MQPHHHHTVLQAPVALEVVLHQAVTVLQALVVFHRAVVSVEVPVEDSVEVPADIAVLHHQATVPQLNNNVHHLATVLQHLDPLQAMAHHQLNLNNDHHQAMVLQLNNNVHHRAMVPQHLDHHQTMVLHHQVDLDLVVDSVDHLDHHLHMVLHQDPLSHQATMVLQAPVVTLVNKIYFKLFFKSDGRL